MLSTVFVQRGMLSVLKRVGYQHTVVAACRTFPNLLEVWKYNFVGFCRRNCFVISLHVTGNLSDKLLRLVSITVENYLLYKRPYCVGECGLSYLPNCVFVSPTFLFSDSVLEKFTILKYALILRISLCSLHFHNLHLSFLCFCYSSA